MPSSQILSVYIGVVAVIIFAGTFPATKLALEIYSPLHITCLRASCASLFAITFLICLSPFNRIAKSNWQHIFYFSLNRNEMIELFSIGLLLVFGFPGAVAFALAEVSSSYSAVFLAMLPLCLSAAAVIFTKERPPILFWICSFITALLVTIFMSKTYLDEGILSVGNYKNFLLGNFWLLMACIFASVGYTKSALFNKRMSGFKVISWGLCLTSPISFLLAWVLWPNNLTILDATYYSNSFWGVLYLGIFSMFIGNCLWSIALSLGGIAKIGQLQFLQPFITLLISYHIIGETISNEMIIFALSVTLAVIIGQQQRSPVKQKRY